MTVNFEIKGMLAKCLSMEDIIIEHKKVETACFNVHTRVLTLPMWEKASDNVYTMLVLHEISHALWTPDIDWTKEYKIPVQFLNIVEDARIEKLCKRKYPGSPKSFYAGYKELYDQDFFAIADEDVNEFNLADRANLYFKIGNFLRLDFTTQEKEIIDQIASADTFPQVLDAAEALYKYCKLPETATVVPDQAGNCQMVSGDGHEDTEEQSNDSGSSTQPPNNSEIKQSESPKEEPEIQEQGQGSNERSNPQQPQNKQDSPEGSEKEPETEPEVKTMESLEEALKDLVSRNESENFYVEVPELDLKHVIVPNSEIHQKCAEFWKNSDVLYTHSSNSPFTTVDKEYLQFKRSAQKEVNYLVKEFECRKAADSYARASTARTGILDCSRLHNYKFSEDLFKKVTTLADGKNHGLIFVLDWSGSMGEVMMDTVKQLFNLVWFCKKVSIPFEVYAFTTDYPVSTTVDGKSTLRQSAYRKREGVFYVTEWFSMMNLLTSNVNAKTLDDQMKNIFRIAKVFTHSYLSYTVPYGMSLSGTPLNEAVISLHQILPKFQKENKLQKVQCVILTDGEGCPLKYHKEFNRKWESEPYLGICHTGPGVFLRDRKIGNTYSMNVEFWQSTDVLLKNLCDKFPDMNFIGIRVLESRHSGNFIRRYYEQYTDEYAKIMNSWKKEKSFSIKNSGYHTYFGLSGSSLSQDSEFSVPDCASKSQIKGAFMKSFKAKKMNKKILGEFIELVA